MAISTKLERILRIALLSGSVLTLGWGISHPIHGNFYFRQAHVAANIEQYALRGLSLVPSTYNVDVPYALFDFPLFQLLVAALCLWLDVPPLAAARGVNVLVLVVSVLLINRILTHCGFSRLSRLLATFLFVLAPMNLFYFHAPMVDPAAIMFSLASLYGYVRWDGSPPRTDKSHFLLFLTAGVLSALIKSPVYLPVFLSIVTHVIWRHGWRGIARRGVILFVTSIVGAVVGFKFFSNTVNGVEGFFDAGEQAQYFGPLPDRLDARSWQRIVPVLLHEAANPLTFAAAVVGVALFARRYRGRHKALLLGLAGGALTSLLVFFNRFTWHNYYMLPFELPIALFAAYSFRSVQARLRLARARRAAAAPLSMALPALVVAITVPMTWLSFRDLASTPTEWIHTRGQWIRQATTPGDFVVYVVESEDPADWNPVFLYAAGRYGRNLTTRRLERHPEVLTRMREAPSQVQVDRYLVYCPPEVASRLDPILESQGLRLVDASAEGRLYDFEEET